MASEVVIFPDVELWASQWLRGVLSARSEPYAAAVWVGVVLPSERHPRMVQFRRDGGARLDVVREAPRLGVNVWGSSEQEASDLARLVAALLWSAPDGGTVAKVTQVSGPSPVPDVQPRRYMTFELITRGTALA